MVKRRKDQKLRLRNFDARHGRIETRAVVKNRKGLSGSVRKENMYKAVSTLKVKIGRGVTQLWKESEDGKPRRWVVHFVQKKKKMKLGQLVS